MGLLAWIEASALGEWVRSSLIGYPMMITCHAVGMTIMVGLSIVLDLRLLGRFAEIPYANVQRFFGVAWAGFAINLASGTALFASQATTYVTDGMFLLKIALVFAGTITVALLQTAIGPDVATWESASRVPPNVRWIAIASLACWIAATITGRLIAYV